MAGESPDKSEQRKSSGETTGTTGGERDPRLGVIRETGSSVKTAVKPSSAAPGSEDVSPEESTDAARADAGAGPGKGTGKAADGASASAKAPGGDDRLKAAVEAWVAGADEDEADEADSGADAGEGDAETGGAASAPAEKPDPKPAVDKPTAVFKTVTPKDAKADEGAKDAKADEDAKGGKACEADKPAADQPTAVFRTMPAKTEKADKADKSEKAEKADKPAADQPTAVFRTMPPKAEGKQDDSSADDKPAVDKPTAVFKAVAPKDAKDSKDAKGGNEAKAGGKPAAAKPAIEEPTELLKAPTPLPTPGQERKSQFVPLKKDDEAPAKPATPKPATAKPATPKAGAPAKPAAPKPAVPGKPSVPGKPGVPVSAPPPVGPPGGAAARPQGPQQPPAPLDLLAQLTNTPPPPETPVRTFARRVKIWTPLVILLGIVFVVVQSFRPLPEPKLSLAGKKSFTFAGEQPDMAWPQQGQSAVKVLGSGDVGTSGDQKPVPTASVAKVMTAYVILKDHPLKPGEKGSPITIDAQAAAESQAKDESRLVVTENQQFSQYDMLQMLLIPSGNNIARQLARWDSKSEEEFVTKMNAAAKDLGMTNTTYTDPSGLKETTKSTASDQVKLAEVIIKNPVVREIVGKPNATIQGLNEPIYNNNDKLLTKGTGVLGVKTGSSGPAGGALMWAAKRTIDGKERLIVGATMDQRNPRSNDANAHLAVVLENSYKQTLAVQKSLTSAPVIKKGDVVGHVEDGLGGRTPVVATKDVTAVGWAGFTTKFTLSDAGRKLPHSAKAGTEVGELTVGSGADAVKVPVALKAPLAEPSFGSKLTRLG
ncbi:D-alanyl-D-alanine carboxypeptidase [Streptomyces triculaminicus]|uniref:D-alanyl-D-alanine carboxypeptidase n=1 Tax=Streptomyces triculaminicus TaxID=2816232 RepID=A0A939FL88_9ACTN|nr:D-alanyl-D-alanine carboxypeptidase [Streptomyces triculaminicus]